VHEGLILELLPDAEHLREGAADQRLHVTVGDITCGGV
jgi:hypothetical protein